MVQNGKITFILKIQSKKLKWEITTLPFVPFLNGYVFSIHREKMYGANSREIDIRVLFSALLKSFTDQNIGNVIFGKKIS